jgi:hypothetical protein
VSGRLVEAGSVEALASRQVLDVRVDATSYAHATDRIIRWAKQRQPRYVWPGGDPHRSRPTTPEGQSRVRRAILRP